MAGEVSRWGIIVATMAGGLGCRGSSPPEQPVAASAPEHPHEQPEAPRSDEPPFTQPGASSVVLTPPPLQVFAPIAPPFESDAIVVHPVNAQSPVVLFSDELAAIRRHVATMLDGRGYPIIPVDELQRIEAAAAEGRLVLEGDRRCTSPLSPSELTARYVPSSPRAYITASCTGDCSLVVGISDPKEPDAYQSYSSPPIKNPHDPRTWVRARLRRRDSIMGGIIGGLVGLHNPHPIMFSPPQSIGPWTKPPSEQQFSTAQRDVGHCAHPDARTNIEYEIMIAVGANGQVARCEATTHHPLARTADAQCLCEGIEAVRFSRGRTGRRVRIPARDVGTTGPTHVIFSVLQPGTDAWIDRLNLSPALSTCLAEAQPDHGFTATAVLGLAADGGVEQVQVFGEIDTAVEMKFSGCLVRELRQVPLPCSPPGIDTLQTSVTFTPP